MAPSSFVRLPFGIQECLVLSDSDMPDIRFNSHFSWSDQWSEISCIGVLQGKIPKYHAHIRQMRCLQGFFAPLICTLSAYGERLHAERNQRPACTGANPEPPGIIAATMPTGHPILYNVVNVMVLKTWCQALWDSLWFTGHKLLFCCL